jgi:2,3-dihydroxybenzoate decarboxylase
MGSGIFDDYPNLKLILGHPGEGLPSKIWHMDNRISRTLGDRPKAKRSFSHYLSENFFITKVGISGPRL